MRLARLAVLLACAPAAAEPLVGTVTSIEPRWAGDRIVTRAVVAPEGGAPVEVQALGGALDGVGMRVADLPALAPGERTALWLEDGWLRAKVSLAPGATRRAYVRAETAGSRRPIYWGETSCACLVPDARGSDDLPLAEARAALDRALASWRDAAGACSYFEVLAGEPRADRIASYTREDANENVLVFEEEEWGRPAEGVVFPAGATGLTTLFFVDDPDDPEDGRLIDADIQLNGVDWAFTTSACDAAGRNADLENTLAHELGHLFGLDHTCDTGRGEPPADDEGVPLPACDVAPEGIRATTMFGFSDPCEMLKRTPTDDDVDGLCAIYPIADDPGCDPDASPLHRTASSGCSTAPRGSPATAWPLLLLVATVLIAKRRPSVPHE